MFTGIIIEVGKIVSRKAVTSGFEIGILCSKVHKDVRLGDSIAVNGMCLTVTRIRGRILDFFIMGESLRKSYFSKLSVGSKVNLEPALTPQTPLGGHIVSGHIDGTGTITNIRPDGESLVFTIKPPAEILNAMVYKGSVAIDGISLTISDLTTTEFQVSIIPFTQSETTLTHKRAGDTVNIETDIMGKYAKKYAIDKFANSTAKIHTTKNNDINKSNDIKLKKLLSENGFLTL